MRRKTFDVLLSATGLLMAVVLFIAGGLLVWSYAFINGQVHDQLAAQKIYFPAADSKAVSAPAFAAMRQYGGQQMTTGAQAETYADHFIAVHLIEIGGGKTYAQVSAEAQADPTNTRLATQADALFKGNTLRGLLLNAYAFWKMGQVALIAAVLAFVAAAGMLVLAGLGFRHSRRVSPDQQIPQTRSPEPVGV